MELCKFFNSKVSVNNNNNNNNNNDNNSNNNNNNKEDLKTYWKLTTLFLSFSKILPQRGGKVVDFRYLNAETTDGTYQQSGNEDYFRDIFQSSAGLYESSGSQFFSTTTEIKSGPDALGESMLAMTLTGPS